ncbi:hypothetical protein J27TS8_03320 [Robertmurraya siralis]|uniref:Uncharacterized protein n=1 Tax=Robertmurraya siralis TaxID=77777 RepID=A0A919WEI0_9BACI|nr:hypothetical protein [Robertmurraya siralis]PAE21935.1 hypothetical protein CHH80_04395 [Bacillus sp. 7504-2]GIN60339.1 hypothetical protein J27TS8_03320 [Robertmurraya siralis]
MLAFKGLYLKDLKISKGNFLIGMGLLFLIVVFAYGLRGYFGEPLVPLIFFFAILVLHVLYLPVILFTSLQLEGQSQLWLHNPNGGIKLFLSKLGAALTYYSASLLATFLLLQFAISTTEISEDLYGMTEVLNNHLLLVIGGVTLTGIYISVWLLFYWTLYHSLKGIPFLSRIRWLVLLVVWIVISTVSNYLAETKVFEVIQEKGTVQLNIFSSQFVDMTGTVGQINLVSIALHVVTAIAVFLISVLLLERKVEV